MERAWAIGTTFNFTPVHPLKFLTINAGAIECELIPLVTVAEGHVANDDKVNIKSSYTNIPWCKNNTFYNCGGTHCK